MLGKIGINFKSGDRWTLILAFIWLILGIFLLGFNLLDNPNIIVEWKTETEFETVGFNIWRRPSNQSELERINEQFIPGSSDPASGGDYKYIDSDVERGQTYYYQLEDIDSDGTSTLHDEFPAQVPQFDPFILLIAIISVAFSIVLGLTIIRRNIGSNL